MLFKGMWGNTDRFVDVAQGIFGQDAIFGLAENQADCRLIDFVSQLVIHHRAVKIHLADILRFEVTFLQFNNDEAAQFKVVEKQIYVKILIAYFYMILKSDKSKTGAKFQQKFFQMPDQSGLQPCSMVRCMYHRRMGRSLTFSISRILCPQGIFAINFCKIWGSFVSSICATACGKFVINCFNS